MREIGRRILTVMGGQPADALEDYLARAARKRVGFAVEPSRIISWDHSKLRPPGG